MHWKGIGKVTYHTHLQNITGSSDILGHNDIIDITLSNRPMVGILISVFSIYPMLCLKGHRLRDQSLILGRGGLQNSKLGGKSNLTPTKKKGGGRKMFSHAEGEGAQIVLG